MDGQGASINRRRKGLLEGEKKRLGGVRLWDYVQEKKQGKKAEGRRTTAGFRNTSMDVGRKEKAFPRSLTSFLRGFLKYLSDELTGTERGSALRGWLYWRRSHQYTGKIIEGKAVSRNFHEQHLRG